MSSEFDRTLSQLVMLSRSGAAGTVPMVVATEALADHLRNDAALIADCSALDALQREGGRVSSGAVPANYASPYIQRVAGAMARRVARDWSRRHDLPIEGLSTALYFTMMSEMATLVPVRQFARRLAREAAGRLIVVPFGGFALSCLAFWGRNELEPLYLAAELRRRGAAVVGLVTGDPKPGSTQFTFQLAPAWRTPDYSKVWLGQEGTALHPMGMRTTDVVRREIGAGSRLGTILRGGGAAWLVPKKLRTYRRTAIQVPMEQRYGEGDVALYDFDVDPSKLFAGLEHFVLPFMKRGLKQARRLVQRNAVQVAHICDHSYPETGLLAGAVLEQGGKIALWPHSANVVHNFAYDRTCVAKISAAAASTAQAWARDFPNAQVDVRPGTVLPPTKSAKPFNPAEPVTLVMFAGGHAIARTPLVDMAIHLDLWRRTLSTFDTLGGSVRVLYKSKTTWETREWIKALAPRPDALEFTDVHANDLDLSNMVFASVSLASTALLEGMARGVPAMILRETPVRETPVYDADYLPIAGPDEIARRLETLTSAAAWEALCAPQREWFARETQSNRL